jgi:hypothetical protein
MGDEHLRKKVLASFESESSQRERKKKGQNTESVKLTKNSNTNIKGGILT